MGYHDFVCHSLRLVFPVDEKERFKSILRSVSPVRGDQCTRCQTPLISITITGSSNVVTNVAAPVAETKLERRRRLLSQVPPFRADGGRGK